jgi:hypothetical protein
MNRDTEPKHEGLDITPETRVDALLKSYPDLEAVLIDLSPVFARLRNPVLRKTVAKVANLRQVAQIGNVSLGEVINTLRRAAGMGEFDEVEAAQTEGLPSAANGLEEAEIWKSFDARAMIESGGHPLNRVLEELNDLPEKSRYELITPFVPAPLIEMVEKKGFRSVTRQENGSLVRTYFMQN